MLKQTISISGILLGLYLIYYWLTHQSALLADVPNKLPTFSSFRSSNKHHLGCYDHDSMVLHSESLLNRLDSTAGSIRSSTQLGLAESFGLDPKFHKNVVKVAKNFETYFD